MSRLTLNIPAGLVSHPVVSITLRKSLPSVNERLVVDLDVFSPKLLFEFCEGLNKDIALYTLGYNR